MAITGDEVLHVARLARIALSEADVKRLTSQLSSIIDNFAALSTVNTEGVEPTAHPLPLANVMRADSVAPSLSQSDVLANAPDTEDGFIRVNAVFE